MGSDNGGGLRRKSQVVVSGVMADGETVTQVIDFEHDAGAPEPMLVGQGINLIRQVGGLTVDADGGAVDFYPLLLFKRVRLAVNRVVLAGARVQ